ncbi:hypothetical protein [Pseudomarimonas arenosa]|uniref:STAS/SEC14 domain-containing protein n=1 Tax=Pseudomarimonas arenosa TaxID=2774145 RepID=A0AAW3ZRQ5_9GAMM|nr:hypothetical protein [Pseudomarimonas arenosa]MBD8528215.1 hypothetical protein [Pseudomarimonas arenosa]
MPFAAHGDIRIDAEFPLLFTYVQGPWNIELVRQWAEQAIPHALGFAARGPWVGGAVIERSMLCTPDALELHRGVATRMVRQLGAVAAVHVALPGTEGADVMHGVFKAMFSGLCPYSQFKDPEEARRWSLQQVAAHQPCH